MVVGETIVDGCETVVGGLVAAGWFEYEGDDFSVKPLNFESQGWFGYYTAAAYGRPVLARSFVPRRCTKYHSLVN